MHYPPPHPHTMNTHHHHTQITPPHDTPLAHHLLNTYIIPHQDGHTPGTRAPASCSSVVPSDHRRPSTHHPSAAVTGPHPIPHARHPTAPSGSYPRPPSTQHDPPHRKMITIHPITQHTGTSTTDHMHSSSSRPPHSSFSSASLPHHGPSHMPGTSAPATERK